jgi:hypothetical protein
MIRRGYIKHFFLLAFILLSAFRGSMYANAVEKIDHQKNEVIKTAVLIEEKGIIESMPEVSNGAAFQYNIFKLKNSFGSSCPLVMKNKVSSAFTIHTQLLLSEKAKTPLYLFNRSILI